MVDVTIKVDTSGGTGWYTAWLTSSTDNTHIGLTFNGGSDAAVRLYPATKYYLHFALGGPSGFKCAYSFTQGTTTKPIDSYTLDADSDNPDPLTGGYSGGWTAPFTTL
jgi:hypothetical protein